MAGLALCLAAAGCGSIGPTLVPSAQAPGVKDFSVAVESIDGLPRDVSQRLVHDLSEEAAALRIAVVPAGAEATYRMRGYVAARAERSAPSITSVSWAWDVYDGELHRAFRLSGVERAGPAPARDAGSALADEAVLRAIAHTGMQQLAEFAASAPAPAAPVSPPPLRGSAVASRGDMGSVVGAQGALRDEAAASFVTAAVPLPRRRPVLAGLAGAARLADATAGR